MEIAPLWSLLDQREGGKWKIAGGGGLREMALLVGLTGLPGYFTRAKLPKSHSGECVHHSNMTVSRRRRDLVVYFSLHRHTRHDNSFVATTSYSFIISFACHSLDDMFNTFSHTGSPSYSSSKCVVHLGLLLPFSSCSTSNASDSAASSSAAKQPSNSSSSSSSSSRPYTPS